MALIYVETDPETHRYLNRFRSIVGLIFLFPLATLIGLWIAGYCSMANAVPIGWTIGTIIWRFLWPTTNCHVPPYPYFFEGFMGLYTIINIIWQMAGVIILVICIGDLAHNYSAQNAPIWILVISTYAIDFACVWFYICYRTEKLQKMRAEIQAAQPPPPPPVNLDIKTHNFYTVCVVCTDEFKEGDAVKELPCRHIFHPPCLNEWLRTHKTCPTCITEIASI